MSNLSEAGQRLIYAETEYEELKTYYDGLPTDLEQHLGFSISINWGSSGRGAGIMRLKLQTRLAELLRDQMAAIVRDSRAILLQRESELKHVAEHHRRA